MRLIEGLVKFVAFGGGGKCPVPIIRRDVRYPSDNPCLKPELPVALGYDQGTLCSRRDAFLQSLFKELHRQIDLALPDVKGWRQRKNVLVVSSDV